MNYSRIGWCEHERDLIVKGIRRSGSQVIFDCSGSGCSGYKDCGCGPYWYGVWAYGVVIIGVALV